MECKTARLLLPLAAELGRDDADGLTRHLAECPDCEAELRLDAHIGRAVRDVPIPAGPKARLGDALAAGRAALWRARALRYVRPLAAAAAVLLVAGLVGALLAPTLDPAHAQWTYNVTRPADADDADAVLGRLGFAACAPKFANYSLLVGGPARGELPGYPRHQVPMLTFASGPHRATVYVVDTRRSGITDLTDLGEGYTYRAHVKQEAGARFAYLILHTGERWDWLLKPVAD